MLIGRLCKGDSFGESTVLKGLPMSCSVVTDTHVQIGTISTFDVYGKISRHNILSRPAYFQAIVYCNVNCDLGSFRIST